MDAPFRIRPAARSDLPEIAALERAVFPDPWAPGGFVTHLGDPFLVAEGPDGVLLGYVVTRVTVPESEILNVAVAPGHRRGGIGRALVRAAVAALAERGAGQVHLEVRASNRAALGLYRNEGFEVVGRRPGYYRNPPEDGLLLARNIGGA
jgi:ribosomal-protein-alanine N-acetyltransferase